LIGKPREAYAIKKDGTIFRVVLSLGEIVDDDGKKRFMGTLRDLSGSPKPLKTSSDYGYLLTRSSMDSVTYLNSPKASPHISTEKQSPTYLPSSTFDPTSLQSSTSDIPSQDTYEVTPSSSLNQLPKGDKFKGISEEIPKLTGITIQKRLGEGKFGEVFLGSWDGTKVALKRVKQSEGLQNSDFFKEANILCKVVHPNTVQFLGVYLDDKTKDFYIVTEYIKRGCLLNVLEEERTSLTVSDLLFMCYGACKGLAYLEKNGVIHRDISLRNFLVYSSNDKYVVKVSDFGLSRIDTSYQVNSSSVLPVKWTSPEVLTGGKFTSKNDVWGFGVAMWEIFSFGSIPYAWLSNKDAFVKIPQGETLPIPLNCPQEVYDVILMCMQLNPDKRPTFKELVLVLKSLRKMCASNSNIGDKKI